PKGGAAPAPAVPTALSGPPSLASRTGPPWEAASPQAGQALRRRPFINLCGDYRFLRAGYWALVDAELNGIASNPSPMQAVTAQNAAACLLVARHAGIETVEWKVARTAQDVEPPSLLVPCSGMTDAHYEVKSARSRAAQWRSATQNGTRAALAVKLDGDLRSMRMIVGVTAHEHYHLAWNVWRTFGVPLATIWYVQPESPESPVPPVPSVPPATSPAEPAPAPEPAPAGRPLFLGLDPLPLHELTERELRLYEEISQRPLMLHPQPEAP
ncbi:MAG TPA: hypothetical protein VJ874_00040, partial [Candidatus Thermoplasmatota archaeon]|nr:hypothetical protein [Candidatus Thermoplasmatota archaeon]